MKNKKYRLIIQVVAIILLTLLYFLTKNREKDDLLDSIDRKAEIKLTQIDTIENFSIKGRDLNLIFSRSNNEWQLSGEEAPVNQKAINKSARALTSLTATDQIEATNDSDFGFDTPHYFITFSDAQSNYNLILGHPTPSQNGYYARLNNDPLIYIISSSFINQLIAPPSYYLDTTIAPFDFTLLTNFSLRNEHGTIVLTQSTNTLLSRFQFIDPYRSFGVDSYQFVDQFLMHWQSLFPFIKANMTTHPSPLARYGLANPKASLLFSNGHQPSLSIEIGDAAEPGISYYAKLTDDEAVFTIDSTLAEQALSIKAFDWLSKFVSLENIEKIASITFKSDHFTLLAHYSTTIEHGSSYLFNGRPTTELSFKNYYQQFLTIFYEGVVTQPISDQVAYQMIFTFTDGTERSIDYLNYNDQFYAVAINKVLTPFLVGSYQLDRLLVQSKKIQ